MPRPQVHQGYVLRLQWLDGKAPHISTCRVAETVVVVFEDQTITMSLYGRLHRLDSDRAESWEVIGHDAEWAAAEADLLNATERVRRARRGIMGSQTCADALPRREQTTTSP